MKAVIAMDLHGRKLLRRRFPLSTHLHWRLACAQRRQVHLISSPHPSALSYTLMGRFPTAPSGQSRQSVGIARLPRFDHPCIPQCVIQRGNDRKPCFGNDDDRTWYLQDLREAAARHAVHADVLMTRHVPLSATPPIPLIAPSTQSGPLVVALVKYEKTVALHTPSPMPVGSATNTHA
jgi:hypothetical protein